MVASSPQPAPLCFTELYAQIQQWVVACADQDEDAERGKRLDELFADHTLALRNLVAKSVLALSNHVDQHARESPPARIYFRESRGSPEQNQQKSLAPGVHAYVVEITNAFNLKYQEATTLLFDFLAFAYAPQIDLLRGKVHRHLRQTVDHLDTNELAALAPMFKLAEWQELDTIFGFKCLALICTTAREESTNSAAVVACRQFLSKNERIATDASEALRSVSWSKSAAEVRSAGPGGLSRTGVAQFLFEFAVELLRSSECSGNDLVSFMRAALTYDQTAMHSSAEPDGSAFGLVFDLVVAACLINAMNLDQLVSAADLASRSDLTEEPDQSTISSDSTLLTPEMQQQLRLSVFEEEHIAQINSLLDEHEQESGPQKSGLFGSLLLAWASYLRACAIVLPAGTKDTISRAQRYLEIAIDECNVFEWLDRSLNHLSQLGGLFLAVSCSREVCAAFAGLVCLFADTHPLLDLFRGARLVRLPVFCSVVGQVMKVDAAACQLMWSRETRLSMRMRGLNALLRYGILVFPHNALPLLKLLAGIAADSLTAQVAQELLRTGLTTLTTVAPSPPDIFLDSAVPEDEPAFAGAMESDINFREAVNLLGGLCESEVQQRVLLKQTYRVFSTGIVPGATANEKDVWIMRGSAGMAAAAGDVDLIIWHSVWNGWMIVLAILHEWDNVVSSLIATGFNHASVDPSWVVASLDLVARVAHEIASSQQSTSGFVCDVDDELILRLIVSTLAVRESESESLGIPLILEKLFAALNKLFDLGSRLRKERILRRIFGSDLTWRDHVLPDLLARGWKDNTLHQVTLLLSMVRSYKDMVRDSFANKSDNESAHADPIVRGTLTFTLGSALPWWLRLLDNLHFKQQQHGLRGTFATGFHSSGQSPSQNIWDVPHVAFELLDGFRSYSSVLDHSHVLALCLHHTLHAFHTGGGILVSLPSLSFVGCLFALLRFWRNALRWIYTGLVFGTISQQRANVALSYLQQSSVVCPVLAQMCAGLGRGFLAVKTQHAAGAEHNDLQFLRSASAECLTLLCKIFAFGSEIAIGPGQSSYGIGDSVNSMMLISISPHSQEDFMMEQMTRGLILVLENDSERCESAPLLEFLDASVATDQSAIMRALIHPKLLQVMGTHVEPQHGLKVEEMYDGSILKAVFVRANVIVSAFETMNQEELVRAHRRVARLLAELGGIMTLVRSVWDRLGPIWLSALWDACGVRALLARALEILSSFACHVAGSSSPATLHADSLDLNEPALLVAELAHDVMFLLCDCVAAGSFYVNSSEALTSSTQEPNASDARSAWRRICKWLEASEPSAAGSWRHLLDFLAESLASELKLKDAFQRGLVDEIEDIERGGSVLGLLEADSQLRSTVEIFLSGSDRNDTVGAEVSAPLDLAAGESDLQSFFASRPFLFCDRRTLVHIRRLMTVEGKRKHGSGVREGTNGLPLPLMLGPMFFRIRLQSFASCSTMFRVFVTAMACFDPKEGGLKRGLMVRLDCSPPRPALPSRLAIEVPAFSLGDSGAPAATKCASPTSAWLRIMALRCIHLVSEFSGGIEHIVHASNALNEWLELAHLLLMSSRDVDDNIIGADARFPRSASQLSVPLRQASRTTTELCRWMSERRRVGAIDSAVGRPELSTLEKLVVLIGALVNRGAIDTEARHAVSLALFATIHELEGRYMDENVSMVGHRGQMDQHDAIRARALDILSVLSLLGTNSGHVSGSEVDLKAQSEIEKQEADRTRNLAATVALTADVMLHVVRLMTKADKTVFTCNEEDESRKLLLSALGCLECLFAGDAESSTVGRRAGLHLVLDFLSRTGDCVLVFPKLAQGGVVYDADTMERSIWLDIWWMYLRITTDALLSVGEGNIHRLSHGVAESCFRMGTTLCDCTDVFILQPQFSLRALTLAQIQNAEHASAFCWALVSCFGTNETGAKLRRKTNNVNLTESAGVFDRIGSCMVGLVYQTYRLLRAEPLERWVRPVSALEIQSALQDEAGLEAASDVDFADGTRSTGYRDGASANRFAQQASPLPASVVAPKFGVSANARLGNAGETLLVRSERTSEFRTPQSALRRALVPPSPAMPPTPASLASKSTPTTGHNGSSIGDGNLEASLDDDEELSEPQQSFGEFLSLSTLRCLRNALVTLRRLRVGSVGDTMTSAGNATSRSGGSTFFDTNSLSLSGAPTIGLLVAILLYAVHELNLQRTSMCSREKARVVRDIAECAAYLVASSVHAAIREDSPPPRSVRDEMRKRLITIHRHLISSPLFNAGMYRSSSFIGSAEFRRFVFEQL
ncbi:hypothetical protein FVE85_9000 [Porphyridium purpureum]|uniref:Uncharacterized protein n=1 Tax=Porphyridium purpureum TaxID=35688 RepID=A0A5J4YN93_PORPP|nr:hypothetical protein FVE85_9000 [Porphyridium purpureum]|eukprot:POR6650..scf222_8